MDSLTHCFLSMDSSLIFFILLLGVVNVLYLSHPLKKVEVQGKQYQYHQYQKYNITEQGV